ncbi:hypothetical protein WFZ85_04580 [Flavobacterium sp. j3]|uniref:Glycosyl transferase family 2 n=1 Tax=Flavobacterium aureirubrum TaxID=3133147 RepID=A0ABU9N7F4_9FLAO
MKIQVGFLISYDYELLKNALPRVYNNADTIFLAIDKYRRTWSGNVFLIEESFFKWLRSFDTEEKIIIYEDEFYIESFTPMECEVRERKLLAEKMGIGNWLIQLDVDEYFLDFKKFVLDIRKYDSFLLNPKVQEIQIAAFLINIYKFVEDGFLYVDKPTRCLVATNVPNYKVGRNTRKRIIYTSNLIFHETLSRSEKELEMKIKNWGHKNELNPHFLDKWKSANKNNYRELKNVFYIEPEKWKSLQYVSGKNIEEVSKNFNSKLFLPTSFHIRKKNLGQWFKFLFKNK